ncbi:leucine-rich repeat domain-containing protein [Kibdelosporangium persicum]|uniref:non-specific serine/threonine protein kinase n=1 Tax=Kibdelosporangium persicum TaxID=2698649 RepID=A0ABX2EWT0_9PSEU|nr:leucine-rich repeat domain-containing protein [Kibdelosporangium persicum]NRN63501.1 Leucine Rich Repeat [Kibdelosporangium persicum]
MVHEALRRIDEARQTHARTLDLSHLRLRELPPELAKLTHLTELRLNDNRLTELPDWFADLGGLEALDLGVNHFATVPEPIAALTGLTALDIGYNTYSAIPAWLGDLKNLEKLYLGNANATEVPAWLAEMPHLSRLSLGGGRVATLPTWMKDMPELRMLNVSNNPLGQLPDWLGELTGLDGLYAENVQLTSVPEALAGLRGLTRLMLGYNNLTRLPDWLPGLPLRKLGVHANRLTDLPAFPRLTKLLVDGNKLTRVPEWLSGLTEMTNLWLGRNEITELPGWLAGLSALELLDIGDFRLIALPDWLRTLTRLTYLNVSGNGLVEIPDWIGELRALGNLTLSENRLQTLPDSFSQLTNLTRLNIRTNRFATLPDCLASLRNLEALYASDNYLTSLPPWLTELPALKHLRLSENQLTDLPAGIGRLTELEYLALNRNTLRTLPSTIGELSNLDELHLAGNELRGLPESIVGLSGLRLLDVSGNRLAAVPDALTRLSQLQTLDLHNNRLTTLPAGLTNLKRLTGLTLSGNRFISPPPEIVAGGTASVMAFLRARRQGVLAQWVSKLLVVGEGGVGKTSLVKALTGHEYDIDEPSTHGIRIEHLDLPHPDQHDVRMRLKTWDFGGQEIYHATHQFFLTNRSLFLLVWNARHGWEQGRLRYWLDIISARAPESPIVLVVTHVADRPVDFPLDELRHEYPRIVASKAVDNRTRQGIDELHDLIAAESAKLPLMGSEWPRKWVSAAQALWDSSANRVTPEEMWQMMAAAGVEDATQQRYLAVALHELGDILYYSDDPELCDTVVLQPEWVNEYISKVLDSREVEAAHGLLTRQHLRELWRGLDRGTSDHFLGMMDKYDLSYRVDGRPDDVSLVVERLSWNPPPYQDRWDGMAGAQEIKVLYRLNTMPPGIPTWFIARSHRFSTNTHWRTGAVLKHGEQLALVRADAHRKTVELTVRGPSPAAFFSILDDGLNRTLERFPGLEIRREVPCRCQEGCTQLFDYDDLGKRLTKVPPKYTIECHRSGEDVDIRGLLLGLAPSNRDVTAMSIDQIDQRLIRIEDKVTENTEYNQRMFMRLQHIAQTQQETRCPSVFALVPVKGKRRYELRLYCEEPGAWHRLPEPHGCYPISQPSEWFRKLGPYLQGMLKVLKHAAPLAGPILGITVDQLSQQLKADCDLMKELLNQAPAKLRTDDEVRGLTDVPAVRAENDADFRVLEAMLLELDPDRIWGGLSRTTTPEGLTLYLCGEHRKAYLP